MEDQTPEIWVELGKPNAKRILLCQFYREFSTWNGGVESGSIMAQKDRFRNWLEKTSDQLENNREVWLMGDFNVDLVRRHETGYNRKLIAQMAYD